MASDEKPPALISFSLISFTRSILLILIPLITYVLGAIPVITLMYYLLPLLPSQPFFYIFTLTILLVLCFFFLLIFETFIPGIFIRVFRIKVKPGTYERSINDKGFFLHLLFFVLYRPSLFFIGIIPIVPLRLLFLKIVGLTIGKGSLVAGTEIIDEPYALTVGSNTLIGGYTTIYTHMTYKKMIEKPILIGNNCFIGNKSVLMPGVIIEDDVIVEPNTAVMQDQILRKGKRYQGNPARECK